MAGDITWNVQASVEIFPDVVNRLLDSEDGPVGVAVRKVADRVLVLAQANIGDRYSGHHGPTLASTGKVVPLGGASFAISFNKPTSDGKHNVAVLHHEGKQTGSYPIRPHNQKNILANRNVPARSGGGPFFAIGEVTWTGKTEGNPYMKDAADSLGLRPSGTLLRGRRPSRIFRLRQP